MKKRIIIHPFLFSLFPIIALYVHNKEKLYLGEILLPSIIIIGFTILFLLFLNIGFHDLRKAGITTTLFLFFFFVHGHIFNLVKDISFGGDHIKHVYLLRVWGILFASGNYFLMKSKRKFYNLTVILNIIAFCLVFIPCATIISYEVRIGRFIESKTTQTEDVTDKTLEDFAMNRDVYYIILDGYANYTTLQEVYGFDNREFYDYLVKKGFYIATKSRSNYSWTDFSLASSLNMEYVNDVSRLVGVRSNHKRIYYKMTQDSKVMNFLRSKGYKFIHFGSGVGGATQRNKYADIDIQCAGNLSEFQFLLIQTSILSVFTDYWRELYREKIRSTFYALGKVGKMTGKKFIFAHIMSPHPPFLFDENGRKIPVEKLSKNQNNWKPKEKYLGQLIFVNHKVKILIDQILSQSNISPIIILQSDHGSASSFGDFLSKDWVNPSKEMLRERLRIFNAYYLPSAQNDILYETVTPVNTFRIIFNHYFNKNYPLLDDRSYFSSVDANSNQDFYNVTAKVVFQENEKTYK
ncbi:MAG: hypothetical protein ISS47_00745 [Candidatus Omnitrophica bacterium]|nr:hypothetical protein [Candidatus Omnitrophota bacterium]